MNKATDGYFVPMVKIFKAWNRAHYSKLTGFHMEMLLSNAWPRTRSAIFPYLMEPMKYGCVATAAGALFPALSVQLVYATADPAGLSGNVDTYLSAEDRRLTRQRLDTAATDAQVALRHEQREDHYSAITKWRAIFGEPFPAYS